MLVWEPTGNKRRDSMNLVRKLMSQLLVIEISPHWLESFRADGNLPLGWKLTKTPSRENLPGDRTVSQTGKFCLTGAIRCWSRYLPEGWTVTQGSTLRQTDASQRRGGSLPEGWTVTQGRTIYRTAGNLPEGWTVTPDGQKITKGMENLPIGWTISQLDYPRDQTVI